MPGPGLAPLLPGQIPVDDVPPPGPECQLDRGRVHHDPIANGYRAGQLGQHIGPLRPVPEIDLDTLQAAPLFEQADDDPGAERRHPRTLRPTVLAFVYRDTAEKERQLWR